MTKSDLINILRDAHEWIKTADQKVSIFLTFQGVLITLFFFKAHTWLLENYLNLCLLNLLFIVAGIVLLAISILKSLKVIVPQLTKKENTRSLIYFYDIAKFSMENYKKKMKTFNDKQYKAELLEQIYISSNIAMKKYKLFEDSIVFFLTGAILLIVTYFVFVLKHGN
jgi:hypothetical protein